MNRWWVDVKKAQDALSLVDDSDVANGVGVALLGYHGLSRGVLKPLVSQTLVDVQTVSNALREIDLAPVSKALANATKSIMGDASERYGTLLAENIHKSAVEATERLLLMWTNNGVAWPNAVDRASEVHGVPLDNLGRYATVMKAAVVQPAILADYADRELMRYASNLAHRESTVDNTLVIKQEFNEEEHPRGEGGRFSNKTKEEASVSDIRELRNLRRKRRTSRANQVEKPEVGEKKQNSSLSDLIKPAQQSIFNLIKPLGLVEEKSNKGTAKRTGSTRKGSKRVGYLPKADPDAHIGYYDEPVKDPITPYLAAKMPLYFLVPKEAMVNIGDAGGTFYAGNIDTQSSDTFCVSMDQLRDYDTNASFFEFLTNQPESISDTFVLCMAYESGHGIPVSYDDDEDQNSVLARKDIVPQARFKIEEDYLDKTGTVNPIKQTIPLGDSTFRMPVVNVRLINKERFTNPDGAIHKNLDESELENFNLEHPRGEGGRFTDKAPDKQDVSDVRSLRKLRRQRANSRDERQRVVAEQKDKASLSEVRSSNQNVFDLIKPNQLSAEGGLNDKRVGAKRIGVKRKAATRAGYATNDEDPKIDFSKMSGFLVPIEDEMTNDTFDPEDLDRLNNLLEREAKSGSLTKRPLQGDILRNSVFGDLLSNGPTLPDGADPSISFGDMRYLINSENTPGLTHAISDSKYRGTKVTFRNGSSAYTVAKFLSTNRYFEEYEDHVDDTEGSWQYRVHNMSGNELGPWTVNHDFISSSARQVIIMGTDEECDAWEKGKGQLELMPDVYSFNDLYSRRASPDFDQEIEAVRNTDAILNPPVQVFTIKL